MLYLEKWTKTEEVTFHKMRLRIFNIYILEFIIMQNYILRLKVDRWQRKMFLKNFLFILEMSTMMENYIIKNGLTIILQSQHQSITTNILSF